MALVAVTLWQGVGKGTVVTKLKEGYTLKHLGNVDSSLEDVVGCLPLYKIRLPWTPQNTDGHVMKPQKLLLQEHSRQMLPLHHLKY
jgi:hypothetical protein